MPKISRPLLILLIVAFAFLLFKPRMSPRIQEEQQALENKVIHQYTAAIEQQRVAVQQSIARLSVSDPALRQCIEAAAMDRANIDPGNTGAINNVSQLPMLSCPRRHIHSIDGIDALTQLNYLDLSDNPVADIRPLLALSQLQILELERNPMLDPTPLQSMRGLQSVLLPNLPKMACADVQALVEHIKRNNAASIQCSGENATTRSAASNTKENNYELNENQEAELREYDNELRSSH